MRGIWAQLQDKPRAEITPDDVSDTVMNIVGKATVLDEKSAKLFHRLLTWVLKGKH